MGHIRNRNSWWYLSTYTEDWLRSYSILNFRGGNINCEVCYLLQLTRFNAMKKITGFSLSKSDTFNESGSNDIWSNLQIWGPHARSKQNLAKFQSNKSLHFSSFLFCRIIWKWICNKPSQMTARLFAFIEIYVLFLAHFTSSLLLLRHL